MLPPSHITLRPAVQSDALCLGILATQVFLNTYAISGINTDLANEAVQIYSPSAFETRLADRNNEITVAEIQGNLVGFLDLQIVSSCPAPEIVGPEVLRLYIQAPFQRQGLGKAFLLAAEARAKALQASSLWLTAWIGNVGALAFYPKIGYKDAGSMQYAINGINYENRIFAKALRSGA
jgi:ribosomal protein S18 acetylase RimI-like enzyme